MGFQITAIVILLAFYGCYFTKMILQRKKGIQTNQMGKGKTGLVKRIEITMKIASLLVPAAEFVSIVLGTSPLPLWTRTAGAVVGICGVVVFVLAVVTMRDSWRAGVSETERTELVTGGIYQISRNPAFLGFDLVYIGIVLMFFNWVLLALSVFAGLMFHLQIVNVEEDFLVRTFGETYLDYRKKGNRYLVRKIGG
ncbi:MAG: isoprenylcysteine carboxylmethyltransferase family protein [Lachnospiraceae bacterium]|nr:isoprenylcysteine carboxylmethyltransferase family protein [Lachnospiraceae bacterium]